MPTKYVIETTTISCYMIGEPESGTEKLIPEGVTPVLQNYDEIKASLGPGQLFEDPYFPAVKTSISYDSDNKNSEIEGIDDIEWRRPSEILKDKGIEGNPIFIDNGGDPEKVGDTNDVNQGQLGNCWFLCSMAELSRLPEIFWMVVCKENLTQFNPEEYRGIFKFRFAAFGRLIEVVIDDRIPYLPNASSHWSVVADNPRVFWSALMEKAYAKLYSSYQALSGGWIGEALQDFTGGVIDRYDTTELNNDKLWSIIGDANKAQFYMGASIMKKFKNDEFKIKENTFQEKTSLINFHAYSLLLPKEVEIKGRKYKLIRLRNPWGNAYEFEGRFRETGGALWKNLDDETKKQFPASEDGEFWMTLKEFKTHFRLLEVVNLNPFGSEGKSLEELCEHVNFTRLLKDGEWTADNNFGPLGGYEEKDEGNEEGEDDGEDKGEDDKKDDAEDEGDKENDVAEDNDEEAEDKDAESEEKGEAGDNEEAEAKDVEEEKNSEAETTEDAEGKDTEEEDNAPGEESGSDNNDTEEESDDDDEEAVGEEEPEREYTEEDYNTFFKNPQIKFTVPEIDLDEEGKSPVVISLFQRYRRNLKRAGGGEVTIGLAIAKVQNSYPVTGTEIFNNQDDFEDFEVENCRSNTQRVSLKPGDYVVIPYNSDKVLGGYTVIVFTKK